MGRPKVVKLSDEEKLQLETVNNGKYMEYLLKTMLEVVGRDVSEKIKDVFLVETISNIMLNKLEIGRLKGRHGWWEPRILTMSNLKTLLQEAIQKEDRAETILYSSMLLIREEMEKQHGK